MNEQQNTQTPQLQAPSILGEPAPANPTPTLEQQPQRRSVFLADENLIVNTSLRRAQDLQFAIDTEMRNRSKDRYFAFQELDESIPDTTHRIWKTPFRAVGNAGVSMWQAGERFMGGSIGAAMDWYEFGARGREASRKYREKLAELEKGALTVFGAQTLDQRKQELNAAYLKELEQISADYEANRRHGRNALLIMEENHRAFREQAGLERNEKDGFIYDLFNAGGSLAFAIGLTVLTGSPAAAAVAFGTTAGQQDYEEALKNGVSPDRALLAGIGGGVFEGGIELLGMEMLFKSLTRTGVLGRIAASALSEGSEEATQQIAEEIIMQNFGGRVQDFENTLKGIGYSFVLGSLTAAPVAVLMNRASAELQSKGIDKETADKMAMNMAKAVATPENVQATHDILSNATSPLNYREGDVIKAAQDFKQTIDKVRTPDRETIRAMYNAGDRVEQQARQAGLDETSAELMGNLEQARFNSIHNQAGLKAGEFEETQIEFAGTPTPEQAQAAQQQADAQVREDVAAAREQWKKEYEEYQARKAAENAQANAQMDAALAGLPEDFDFTLAQEKFTKDNTPKTFNYTYDTPLENGTSRNASVTIKNEQDSQTGNVTTLTFSSEVKSKDGKNIGTHNNTVAEENNISSWLTDIKDDQKEIAEDAQKIKIKRIAFVENPHNGYGFTGPYAVIEVDTIGSKALGEEKGLGPSYTFMGKPTPALLARLAPELQHLQPAQQQKTPYVRQQEQQAAPRVSPENITEVHNQQTGEVIPLEMNPNLATATASVHTVQPLEGRISNANAYKDAILGKADHLEITNKATGDTAFISQSSTDKIYSSAIVYTKRFIKNNNIAPEDAQTYYNDALAIAANVKPIFENATYILQHRDVNGLSRNMKRYAAAVNVADRPYLVMISVKDSGELAGLQLYDLQAENKSALAVISGKTRQHQGENIVADLTRFVKRKLAKYNKNAKPSNTLELLQENLFDMQQSLFDGPQSLFETQAQTEENKGATQDEAELKEAADSLFTEEELKPELPKFKPTTKPERIEDFGEKIHGARKDMWGKYTRAMTEEIKGDMKDITLSRFFPEPNYEAAIAQGISVEQLAIVKALRDSIPTKPQLFSRALRWVEGLKAARETANRVLNDPAAVEEVKRLIAVLDRARELNGAQGRMDLYLSLGYPAFTKAKNYTLRSGNYLYYRGTRFDKPTTIYELVRGYRSLAHGTNKEEVIAAARKLLEETPTQTKAPTKLDIYQKRATGEIIIGKKIASGKYIDLKGGFTRVKDAIEFLEKNQPHLEALLEEKRKLPPARRETNDPRVGKEYRPNNTVVTPERFSQEFGFRGVQFGNWVEQGRRAADLNNAYDALLDMVNIINIPARAVSLDGTLGLAFGARGHKGASAHYETDEVVINLTKEHGAGSLGHEWWHALDNFFGRTRTPRGMITSGPNRYEQVRPELRKAYENVVQIVRLAIGERSRETDKTRTVDYWSTPEEMTARAFETYLIYKGKQQGYSNDYLANIAGPDAWIGRENMYPYPLDSEMPAVAAAFDNFFNVLKTQPTPRGYTLYEEPEELMGDNNDDIENADTSFDFGQPVEAPNAEPAYLGKVTFDMDSNRAVIAAAKSANKSTAVHEFFHVWEHDLYRAEKVSTEAEFLQLMQDLRAIHASSYDFVIKYLSKTKLLNDTQRAQILQDIEARGGKEYIKQLAYGEMLPEGQQDTTERFVRRAFRENFSISAEKYFMKGNAPSATYKKLFERFAQWLREIYGALAGVEIAPDVQAFFDKLLTREARRVDSKLFTGKVDALREQVRNIRNGSPNGNFTLEEIKGLLDVLDAPAPKKPRHHLMTDLRRYGANYAAAGRIDAEVYKQKFIFNKKGGVGDDPYRWLADRGYMTGEGMDTNLTYEDLDRLNDQAYDMIERALDGEIIYPLGEEERAAEYENYQQAMDVIREVWGEPREARKTLRAILDLEEKGYRVVEKKDLTALSLRLGELNKLADRLDNKSQTVRQKEEAEKATLDAAQKIKRRVVDELNKRELEGKAEIVKNLQSAKTFDDIQTATAQALDFLEDAYDKTEAGQEERHRTDLPNTDWDKVRAQLLRAYTDSVGQVDERVREAWKVRTAITTGSTSLYGWDADEVQRRRQQSEKVLAEAEPKLEAALMRATSKVLFNIGGLESDQIRRLLSFYGKSATRQRALYKGNIDSLVRQAQALQEDNYKKYMNKKIQDILNLNLFDKRGNLRKATVDQYTLASLQELKRVANLGPQSAADELAARMDRFSNGEIEATPTDKIINEMLSIQAYDRKDVSVQLYKQAYEDIANLRRHGRSTKNLQKMIMDFQTEQDKSDVLKAVAKNKEAGTLKRMYASWIANWESFLDLATDNATKEKYSMLNLEADTITYSWQRRTEIMDGVKEIYKLGSNREVQNKMNQLRKEKHTFTNYAHVDKSDDPYHIKRTGEAFQEELSKMQIITAYIYYQNDNLADRLTQQYGNEQLGAMWNLLDKQDIELAKFLQRQAEKSYAQINEVFVKERGYDLPRVQNYFPSVTERVESELDFLHAAQVMSKNPSFTKMRASSPFIQMRLENPFGILFRHIDRAADYHFKAEKLNQIRRVFKSPVVKPAIIEKVGEDVYKRMLELIDQFSVTKPRLNYDMDKLGDWLTNNYVKGAIALKPTIAIKQLVSSINYAEQMPTTQWIAGFTDAIMHPKQTVKFMMEGDPYLKARYESGSMNEALARATADANAITAKGKFLRFTDLLTINTRLGDVGAIMFGGKPYVDYLMKEKKMTKEKAFAEFRKATLRSQQANTRSSLSTLQARDMNFLVRGLFAFKNTPAQYARKIADAISQYQRGEIDKKQLAKVVAIYGLLNSWMYSMLTSLGLLAWYFDSDDADELLTEELFFSPFTQMATALPVLDMAVGQAANVAKAKLFDHSVRLERPELPVVSELFKMGGKVLKEEVSSEDVLDMLVTGGQIFGGLPTQYAKGIYTGAADTITGENPMRGFLQALGYTENRAKIATNTKE